MKEYHEIEVGDAVRCGNDVGVVIEITDLRDVELRGNPGFEEYEHFEGDLPYLITEFGAVCQYECELVEKGPQNV